MTTMMIRPTGAAIGDVPYAVGRFGREGCWVVNQIGGRSAFGNLLCTLGSSYAVDISPNGFGRTWYAGSEITPPDGLGKVWYIRDKETGDVWSPFYSPACGKSDDYEVVYEPGIAVVHNLKHKIASTLTVAVVPGASCEVWHVSIENRSARDRSLEFTTFAEPFCAVPQEIKYLDRDRAIIVQTPLESIDTEHGSQPLTYFQTSSLTPSRIQTVKSDFIGDGRTLRNPIHVENDKSTGEAGIARGAVTSMSADIDLPIEGEARFGFCFGAAEKAEDALKMARSLNRAIDIQLAAELTRQHWQELTSSIHVDAPDPAFNALVNTWLPYEAYASWLRSRHSAACVDPLRAADLVRRLLPLTATAPDTVRQSILTFAAGVSIMGAYKFDERVAAELPARELLWLAQCTARYVAETGDTRPLDAVVTAKSDPRLTLKEHCERAIAACINGQSDACDPMLDRLVADWPLAIGDSAALNRDTLTSRRLSEKRNHSEERALPRRVRYLQSVSRSVGNQVVLRHIMGYLGNGNHDPGDTASDCSAYCALVEDLLGLRPTADGLVVNPDLPESWASCDVVRRFRGATYNIHITRSLAGPSTGMSVVVDGEPMLGQMLPVFADGAEHEILITLD